jgi:hypothetical protein
MKISCMCTFNSKELPPCFLPLIRFSWDMGFRIILLRLVKPIFLHVHQILSYSLVLIVGLESHNHK